MTGNVDLTVLGRNVETLMFQMRSARRMLGDLALDLQDVITRTDQLEERIEVAEARLAERLDTLETRLDARLDALDAKLDMILGKLT